MRKRNFKDMTVVEQLIKIREDTCLYACKYRDKVDVEYDNETLRKVAMQGYCHECPLMKLHYMGSEND